MGFIRINISTAVLTLLVLATIAGYCSAEQKNSSETKPGLLLLGQGSTPSTTLTSSNTHSTPRDEIYIDDESLEGSGGRGEIHDDLEKEPEYSGSGFGPDDEDSSTNHHERTYHNIKNTNRKDETRFTDLEAGSGDTIDNEDDEIKTDNNRAFIEASEDDDLTTEIKHTDIDSTTTDVDDLEPKYPEIAPDGGILPIGGEIELNPEDRAVTVKPFTTGSNVNSNPVGNEVFIMDKAEDRTTNFFSQPGILAAVIGGAVVGLLCAILVVMFIVYRMRKKDEGSYALDEPKRSPAVNSYAKNANNREFYA